MAIKDEVKELSAKIKKAMSHEAGVVSVGSKVYEENLPTDLSMKVVKEVSDYNTTFVAAGTHAFGEIALDAMKHDKKLETVSGTIPMFGKDKLNIEMARSKEVTIHLGEKAGTTETHYGSTRATYSVYGGKNKGQLAAVRAELSELASAALKK